MSNKQIEYDSPDAGELLALATNELEASKSIEITSPAMYELAADQLREVKAAIKIHTERRLGITRKFDDLKKDVMSLFAPALNKLDEAKTFLESGMIAYNRKVEDERRAEQARLQAIADAEKRKLEEEVENVRKQAAAAAEQARASGHEEEAAAIAEAAHQEADSLTHASQVVTAAPTTTAAPVASGTSTRITWKGRCDNLLELIRFVADHPEYVNLLSVDQTALNALARSQKSNMKVGGCVAVEDMGISSRRA